MIDSYLLVTPMRNESTNLYRLFASVLSQDLPPSLWIIVDDGSTDKSKSIATDLTKEHPDWIKVVERNGERGWLHYGDVVSFGIDIGLEESVDNPIFVAVLDADTVLEPGYFNLLASDLCRNPKGAIATGLIREDGELGLPRGCARMYDVNFLKAIGGFPKAPSPDTILEIKARNRGYAIIIDKNAKGQTRSTEMPR